VPLKKTTKRPASTAQDTQQNAKTIKRSKSIKVKNNKPEQNQENYGQFHSLRISFIRFFSFLLSLFFQQFITCRFNTIQTFTKLLVIKISSSNLYTYRCIHLLIIIQQMLLSYQHHFLSKTIL
jgi:hypothetical protein